MKKYQSRKDVPEKYKWDLTDYFKSDEECLKALEETKQKLPQIKKYVGHINDPKMLKEYLELISDLDCSFYDLIIYTNCHADEDLSVNHYTELFNQVMSLNTEYELATAFFTDELLGMDKVDFDKLISSKELENYVAFLKEKYRYKEHKLSENEEKIVSLLTEKQIELENNSLRIICSNHNYGEIEHDGVNEEITVTKYSNLMSTLPREKRKEVFLKFNQVIDQYADVNASYINEFVHTSNNIAKIYGFKSAWDSRLFALQLPETPVKIMSDSIAKHPEVRKKYNDIKKRVNHLDELEPWDGYLELYQSKKEYTIEEAIETCQKAIKVLGSDYENRFNKIITNHDIDYCEYKGKKFGGYCMENIHPIASKILMSFNGDIESVSTLVHECGHHVNHQYISENNLPFYCYTSEYTGEIASLTNECLLAESLINSGDKESALASLGSIIGTLLNNLNNAVMECDMEREFYQYDLDGGTITKDYLKELVAKTNEKFNLEPIRHDLAKINWTRRTHYFYNFYLYSYAFCACAATVVSKRIAENDEAFIKKYQEFLKTGSDLTIMEIFKKLDIDLENESTYEDCLTYIDSLMDKFIKIYEEVENGRS